MTIGIYEIVEEHAIEVGAYHSAPLPPCVPKFHKVIGKLLPLIKKVSVDLDLMRRSVLSDLGLRCLPVTHLGFSRPKGN